MATGTDSRVTAIHEEFLMCKICFEELNQPKSLPCLHTFCLQCLEQHARRNRRRNNKIACPLCRQECKIPPTGVQDLPTNFMLQELKDVVLSPPKGPTKTKKNTLVCEFHPLVASKWFCNACYTCLCQNCKQSHPQCDVHHCISMNNESQFLNDLRGLKQKEDSIFQNKLEKWSEECKEIRTKANEVHEAKEKVKEETNKLFADITTSLTERKRIIHEKIDNIFEQEIDPFECLIALEDFEDELVDTTLTLASSQQQPNDLEAAIKHCRYYEPVLKLFTESLEGTYEVIKKGKTMNAPKVRLEVFEDTLDMIKNKHLVKLHILRGPNIAEIKCRQIVELSAKMNEHKVYIGDIVAVRNDIYFTDALNNCVKMIEDTGNMYALDKFKDRYDYQEPWSLCYLPNNTIAASYVMSPVIKIFNCKGMFLRKENFGENSPTLLPLSDGTIAVGCDDHRIKFFTQDFVYRGDIPKRDLGMHPKYMCADKNNNIYYSDGHNVHFWDRSKNSVKCISNHINRFHPCGVSVDKWGNLVVASQNFSKIHIFSQEENGSRQERVLLDQRMGRLHQPCSVAFSAQNELIVGQSNGKIKKFAYTSTNQ